MIGAMGAQPGRVARFFVLGILLLLPNGVKAQASAPESIKVDPAIVTVAGRLVEGLHKIKAKRIALFDLYGPEREVHPVGKWLADELATALTRAAPDLQLIDRVKLTSISEPKDKRNDAAAYRRSRELAKTAGADAFVMGGFARLTNRIGITLSARSLNGRGFREVTGAVPISDEILALSSEPIPTFTGDVPRAGAGGVTSPTCKHCPLPEYTSEARSAKYQGEVSLDVIVTAEGTTGSVVVIRGPGYGLEERSIKAVRKWRFNPAVDPDGKAVAVRVEIEVAFTLF